MYDKNYYTDELTGVLNRRYLPLIGNREIGRCKWYNGQFSIYPKMAKELDSSLKLLKTSIFMLKGEFEKAKSYMIVFLKNVQKIQKLFWVLQRHCENEKSRGGC